MALHAALTHRTEYRYDRLVGMAAHTIRLRPAPHCRTPILAYSLRIEPAQHFINWQQDPFGNFLARIVFPEKAHKLVVTVDLVADMAVINPFDFFLEPQAEKIPFACLAAVQKDMRAEDLPLTGIYLAHDSMGAVRYAGRGNIFQRLRTCHRAQPLELLYFSLYVIENNKHEREIETLVIRATSHLLDFNDRKKRPTIQVGNMRDYEPGTTFYQRQSKKGKKRKAK